MLNHIWMGLLLAGFFIALLNGRIEAVTQAAIDSAGKAIELAVVLLGVMCLWTGLMEIAEKSGLVRAIAKLAKPVLKFLFTGVPVRHPAMGAIVMNLTANSLGLGNAATPLGLKAMKELGKLCPVKDTATDDMCMFLVLNTSAVQLIPVTIIAVRAGRGSANPAEIIGAIWAASACANAAGITAVKLFQAIGRRKRR